MCTCIACRLIQTYLGNDHFRPEQFLRVRGVASSFHPIHWWPWLNSFADTSWPSCALWVTTGSQISKVFPRKRLEATSANLIRPGPKWLWTTSTNTAPPFWRFGRWFRAFLGLLVCSLKCMFVEGSVLYVNLQRMIECFGYDFDPDASPNQSRSDSWWELLKPVIKWRHILCVARMFRSNLTWWSLTNIEKHVLKHKHRNHCWTGWEVYDTKRDLTVNHRHL